MRSGNYQSHWSFYLKNEAIAPGVFSFGGYHYFLRSYQPQRTSIYLTDVYLDLNESWSEKEFESLWVMLHNKNVWVYTNELVQVTEANKSAIFNELRNFRFSLFPIQKVVDTEHSLLITKSSYSSPDLSDIKESNFFNGIKKHATTEKRIKLFNLGQNLSPYLASLKEYRFFDYENGGLRDLKSVLSENTFASATENENAVTIHNAGLSIIKQQGEIQSTAPDHVMRLFAYNNIMRQLGQKALNDSADNTVLVKEAEAAYVVSPVSSLIVLETQQDYDRFDINNSEQSLKNASAKSNGAVPEPHEWVLIVLAAIIAFFLFMKTRV
jgi:XrtN system VIT domain protein